MDHSLNPSHPTIQYESGFAGLAAGHDTIPAEVGMTGTARSMRMILAVHLLGRIGMDPLVPNTGLAGINGIGQTTQIGACGADYRRSAS